MPTPRLHPLVRLIIFAAGVLLAMVAAAGVVSVVSHLMPSLIAPSDFNALMLAATLSSYPLILCWMWFCRRKLDLRSFQSLGVQPSHAGRDCLFGVLCGGAAIAFLFGVLLATGFVHLGAVTGHIWSSEALEAGVPAITRRLLLWAVVFAAVGVVEELVFRGYALHNLTAWMGIVGATLTQAAVFAVVHMQNLASQGNRDGALAVAQATPIAEPAMHDALRAIPALFLIGVFFALCYLKTGSLWFPVGFHAAWNFCVGCVFSLPVSGITVTRLLDVSVNGSSWMTGGTFGPEGSMLLLPIIAAMNYVLLRQPSHPQAVADLALLRRPKPVAAPIETEDEPHTPRFKTTMRSRTPELEPEVADTLRRLSEAKAARRQESGLAPPIGSEAGTGVLRPASDANRAESAGTTPLQTAPELTPDGSTPPLSRPTPEPEATTAVAQPEATTTVAQPVPAIPEAIPQTSETVEPAPPEPAPSQPVPPQPKKPPAPRW